MRHFLLIGIAVCLLGCEQQCQPASSRSTPVVRPSGKLVWTNGKNVSSVPLAGNVGDGGPFRGSDSVATDGKELGKLEWEFVPGTVRFGDILLVRFTPPDGKVSEHLLHDKAYDVIYADDHNKIEYVAK